MQRDLGNNRKRLVIELVVDLSVEPRLTDLRTHLDPDILIHGHEAGVEKAMEIGAKKQSVPNVVTSLRDEPARTACLCAR